MSRHYRLALVLAVAILFSVVFFLANQNLQANGDAVTMTVRILVCGDEEVGGWEECDQSDLAGQSCNSLGFGGGTLACDPACEFDTSNCLPGPACGDNFCNGTENCSNCELDCGECPASGGGGGGGGGGAAVVASTIFSGRAYPNSTVTLLKDAQVVATAVADQEAKFSLSIPAPTPGSYIFSLYSEDYKGIRSSLLSFPVNINSGVMTSISSVFIAPTIDVDKSEVKQGDEIVIFGQAAANSEVSISVHSEAEFLLNVKTDSSGIYLHNFNTAPLEIGEHFTKSKASLAGEISSFSKAVSFLVGAKNVIEENKCGRADLNCNGKVNLVDFSIAAYWYKKTNPPAEIDLNNDGQINLVDFSIMAYYWTG